MKNPLKIIAFYKPPNNILTQEEWDNVTLNIKNQKNCLFVGDLNAHNTFWNCNDTNADGAKLYNSILKNDIFLHNTDTITHIDFKSNGTSNIDLICSTEDIAHNISYKIHDELLGSDHFPLYITYNTGKFAYYQKTFKIHSLRTNWQTVKQELTSQITDFYSNEFDNSSPSMKYQYFVNKITKIVSKNTPVKKRVHISQHRNPVRWWDSDCERIKRLRKAALKKWKCTLNLEDLIHYKKNKCSN